MRYQKLVCRIYCQTLHFRKWRIACTVSSLLDESNVLIYTANKHCNNYGYVLFEGENKKMGISAFSVTKYDGNKGYYLFSWDLDWNDIGDMLHDSLQVAKECTVKLKPCTDKLDFSEQSSLQNHSRTF